ncbi:MAG: ester cyclase [Paracoccaceae bacterium]|nr:ester cyclase [Paracoccaceae bacterium]MDE2917361.1 ester cyclase [Paracoccaceae bacterium]
MSIHNQNKISLEPYFYSLLNGPREDWQNLFCKVFASDAVIRLGYPLGELEGPVEYYDQVYQPLLRAFPDLEKRNFIVMAGPGWRKGRTGNWIGLGGNFVGTFTRPWLGIPPTGKPVYMRFHEYMKIDEGQVVLMEALWDIPQIMQQAGTWPMAPQLGVEWMCPGPSDGMGIISQRYNSKKANQSVQIVWDMLHDLQKGDAKRPDLGMEKYWHQDCLWYGPAGIGTAMGVAGIREVVLKGFRKGLSTNTRKLNEGVFFGDHNLVAFSGWPSAVATHSGDGFLGLAPTGREFTRRSLDFWRIENDKVRENWVMVDMLDIYRQLGIDVFGRMKALL